MKIYTMAININKPAESNFKEFQNNAQNFHFREIRWEDYHEFRPHQIFELSLADLASGIGLEAPAPTGWRYVIKDKHGYYHIVEVKTGTETEGDKFLQVSAGEKVNGFLKILNDLNDLNDHVINKQDVEISVLRSPALHLTVIWVEGTDGEPEFYIPLNPVPENLVGMQKYNRADLNALLRTMASNLLDGNTPTQDDLTIIEGIGPKIAHILQSYNISSFKSLAEADAEFIKKILQKSGANFNLAEPDTWAEQANLASNEKWDELKTLQNELKGGRRASN